MNSACQNPTLNLLFHLRLSFENDDVIPRGAADHRLRSGVGPFGQIVSFYILHIHLLRFPTLSTKLKLNLTSQRDVDMPAPLRYFP